VTRLGRVLATACLLAPLCGMAGTPPALTVTTPDGSTQVTIARDASRFSIARKGETVIASSPLGLDLDGAPDFGSLTLERRTDTRVDRRIALVASKADSARDHYRGATLVFRERAGIKRRLFIDVRAYDEGIALR